VRGVGAVASEAVVREDRSDISVVIGRTLRLARGRLPAARTQESCEDGERQSYLG
jgi:hypothetical protein